MCPSLAARIWSYLSTGSSLIPEVTQIRLLRSGALTLGLLCAAGPPMAAQLEPTQTLQGAFGALVRRDWRGLRVFVAPTALDSLRQQTLGLIILIAAQRKAGGDASGG